MVSHDRYFAEQVGFTRIWEVWDGAVTEHPVGLVKPAAAFPVRLGSRGTVRNG